MLLHIIYSLLLSAFAQDFNPKTLEAVKQVDPFKTAKTQAKPEVFNCQAAKNSTLNYKLMSTSVLSESKKSIAQFKVGDKIINLMQGEKTSDFEVIKIERLKVFIKNQNSSQCEIFEVNLFQLKN